MKSKTKLILIVFGLGVLPYAFYVVKAYIVYKNTNHHYINGMLPSTYKILPEDSNILQDEILKKISVDEIVNSKERGPVSFYTIGNKYKLAIYRIDLAVDLKLSQLLDIKKISVKETVAVEYRVTGSSLFHLLYKGGHNKAASKIFVTLGGDSIFTRIQNDSILNYDLICQNMSFKYSENEPIDFCFEAKKDMDDDYYASVPLSCLFYKNHGKLVLLFLCPINSEQRLEPKQLYKYLKIS